MWIFSNNDIETYIAPMGKIVSQIRIFVHHVRNEIIYYYYCSAVGEIVGDTQSYYYLGTYVVVYLQALGVL